MSATGTRNKDQLNSDVINARRARARRARARRARLFVHARRATGPEEQQALHEAYQALLATLSISKRAANPWNSLEASPHFGWGCAIGIYVV